MNILPNRRLLDVSILIRTILLVVLLSQLLFLPRIDKFDWVSIKTMIVAGGFCLISLMLCFQKNKNKLSLNAFDGVFITFIGWNFLSITWAINPSLVWNSSLAWLFLFGVYKLFSVIPFQNQQYWLKVLLGILSLNCLFLVAFSINVNLGRTEIGINYNDISQIGRFFYVNGNYIASTLVLQVPLLLYVYLKLKYPKWLEFYFLLLLIIHVFFIFILNSRGASLAFIIQIILFTPIFIKKTKRKQLLLGVTIVILFFCSSLALIQDKATFFKQYNFFKGVQSEYGDDRLTMWDATWKLSQDYPILGVGSGNWKIGYQKMGLGQYHGFTFENERFYTHAHNLYVQILGELGWVGLSLFSILFFLIARYCFGFYKREVDLVRIIPFTLLVGFLVVCCFYGVAYSENANLATPQFIIFGLLFLLQQKSNNKNSTLPQLVFLAPIFAVAFMSNLYYFNAKKKLVKYNHLNHKKKHEMAVEVLNNIYHPLFYTIEDKTVLQLNKARSLFHQQKYEAALSAVQEAIKDAPFFHSNWAMLGQIQSKLKNWEGARKAYEKAYELHYNFFRTQLQLAHLSLREKDYKEVDKWLAFYEEMVLPFIQEYEVNEMWQKQPRIKKLYKKYKNYKKQVLNIREKTEANLSSDK